jgi:hypothetical protein
MEPTQERCTRCVLPSNYPGICFNEDGVCNYCRSVKEITLLAGATADTSCGTPSGSSGSTRPTFERR